jgi:hypothetical protein
MLPQLHLLPSQQLRPSTLPTGRLSCFARQGPAYLQVSRPNYHFAASEIRGLPLPARAPRFHGLQSQQLPRRSLPPDSQVQHLQLLPLQTVPQPSALGVLSGLSRRGEHAKDELPTMSQMQSVGLKSSRLFLYQLQM